MSGIETVVPSITLAKLGPVSQGSVASYPPNSWRWTFEIKGKTARVALSKEQARQMLEAIDNHKELEEIVREMREINQTLILERIVQLLRPGGVSSQEDRPDREGVSAPLL